MQAAADRQSATIVIAFFRNIFADTLAGLSVDIASHDIGRSKVMGNEKRIDEAREDFEQQREDETGDTERDSSSKKAEAEHDARDDYKEDGEPFGSLEKRDH